MLLKLTHWGQALLGHDWVKGYIYDRSDPLGSGTIGSEVIFMIGGKMELFDSHAHYDDEKFDEDRSLVIKQIYESGVTKFMSSGYNIESSKNGLELARKYDYIYTTCGISPNDIEVTKES